MAAAPLDSADLDLSQRDNLSEVVYARLREEIMSGLWKPGERLTIRSQAERFHTSPTPVRDAMLQLAREEALSLAPRSFRVPQLTKAQFLEIRKMRVALETLAAEEAARRAPPGLADELAAIHEELARVKAKQDVQGTMSLNRRFHYTLYAGADMPHCLETILRLWARAAPYMHHLYRGGAPQPPEAHEHLRIVTGIRAGDPAVVKEALRLDITDRSVPMDDDLFEAG